MKESLILLKVQGVQGDDGKARYCLWWYVKGGDEGGADGGVCCDEIKEAMRHVAVVIEEDLKDRPEQSDPEMITGPFRRIAPREVK